MREIFSCLFFPLLPVNSPLMGISLSVLYIFKRIQSYIMVGPVPGPRKHPGAFLMAQWVTNLPAMQETQEMCVQPLGKEGPLEWELPMKVPTVKAMAFPVAMYRCESWMIKLSTKDIDAFELWCWRRLESPLDCKEIKPVNPKGNQP